MPPTAKESYPAPAAESAPGADGSGGPSQIQRRTDAVGAEVPVVVHASRYSSAAAGVGKSLPPVHEETRTVIVFPNGAVVRISSSISAGELVVLTNQQTGTDVICRVVNVKTQPGIQNYVNLEFTQRAPGFWDANSASTNKSRTEAAQHAAPPQLPSPSPTPQTKPVAAPSEIIAPISIPATPQHKAPTDSSPVPTPVRMAEKPRSATVLSGSLLGADYGSNTKPLVTSADAAQMKSWEGPNGTGASGNEASGSKKTLLIVGVAVVALAVGGAGGFWLLRATRQPESVPHVTANSVDQSVPLPPVTTDQSAAAADATAQAAADSNTVQPAAVAGANSVTAGTNSVLAAQPAVIRSADEHPDQPNVRVGNQPVGVQPRVAQAGSVRSDGLPRVDAPPPVQTPNIDIQKLSAPVAKTPASRGAIEAPVVGSQISGLAESTALAGSIAGPAPRLSVPAPARTGGQLQPAKPLSSPAPNYPPIAFQKHIEGVVSIYAEVDNTGRVVSTEVTSGPPELQVAALTALKKWKYQPAMLDGLAVSSHTQVNISFSLPSSASRPR